MRDSTEGDGNRELIDHIDTPRNYGATDDYMLRLLRAICCRKAS